MKVTLHLEGTKMEMIEQLMEYANTLAPTVGTAAAPAKEVKPVKKAKSIEVEEPEEIDLGEDAEEVEETEDEELSLDNDVLPAFQAFVKKGDKARAAAAKIVAKYKVKSVRDIPPSKFKEVLAQLR